LNPRCWHKGFDEPLAQEGAKDKGQHGQKRFAAAFQGINGDALRLPDRKPKQKRCHRNHQSVAEPHLPFAPNSHLVLLSFDGQSYDIADLSSRLVFCD
jgi:hypothetical protein